MIEIWKPIKGYENLYEVSNCGNIKSLYKEIQYSDGRIRKYKEKIMKLKLDPKGYHFIALHKDTIIAQERVHRLVGQVFIDNPDNKPCINHKDSNRINNNVTNLEWVTYRENIQHAISVGRLYKPGKKINQELVIKIRELEKKNDLSQKQIGKMFGISQTQISRIVNNKNWNK